MTLVETNRRTEMTKRNKKIMINNSKTQWILVRMTVISTWMMWKEPVNNKKEKVNKMQQSKKRRRQMMEGMILREKDGLRMSIKVLKLRAASQHLWSRLIMELLPRKMRIATLLYMGRL